MRYAACPLHEQMPRFAQLDALALPLWLSPTFVPCACAVSLSNFIIRGDMRDYYRQRLRAGRRAGQEFLERNKGADRAWLGGFKDVRLAPNLLPVQPSPAGILVFSGPTLTLCAVRSAQRHARGTLAGLPFVQAQSLLTHASCTVLCAESSCHCDPCAQHHAVQ